MHLTLYGLLLAAVALGGASLWAAGATLTSWLTIPAFAPNNRVVWRALAGLHALAADVILVITVVHMTAALAHHCLWRDGVLNRMLPAAFQRHKRARVSFRCL
jgi:cytochrome b561